MAEEEEAKGNKKESKKNKKYDEGGGFANYEDFAHLLEEDVEKNVNDKEKKFYKAKREPKRNFT
jgi:hypothetical protein